MDRSEGIRHYRFRENEVPLTLPMWGWIEEENFEPQGTYFESYMPEAGERPEGFFIELVNNLEETIGLFFILDGYVKGLSGKKIENWFDFAKYYDEINAGEAALTFWQHGEILDELATLPDGETYSRIELESEAVNFIDCDMSLLESKFGKFSLNIISYGRIKYPYGLHEKYRDVYRAVILSGVTYRQFNLEENDKVSISLRPRSNESNSQEAYDLLKNVIAFDDRSYSTEGPSEDMTSGEIGESLVIAIEIWGADKVFVPKVIDLITKKMSMDFYRNFADRFFTKENVDLFIDASIGSNRADLTAFLLEYKNNPFPVEGELSQKLPI